MGELALVPVFPPGVAKLCTTLMQRSHAGCRASVVESSDTLPASHGSLSRHTTALPLFLRVPFFVGCSSETNRTPTLWGPQNDTPKWQIDQTNTFKKQHILYVRLPPDDPSVGCGTLSTLSKGQASLAK